MTAKEKALDLVNIYYNVKSNSASELTYYFAKQCALICVDEILNILHSLRFGNSLKNEIMYYEEVKKEIEKL